LRMKPPLSGKQPGANPKEINTEVFMLPAAAGYERDGTKTNSGRWIQWQWKAQDPPGEAKSDLWIADKLFKALRAEYQAGGKFPDPITKMNWDYGDDADPTWWPWKSTAMMPPRGAKRLFTVSAC
jgi:anaerobic selenocysteine-containing dehydrogenase